jgi:hypothetical protein
LRGGGGAKGPVKLSLARESNPWIVWLVLLNLLF